MGFYLHIEVDSPLTAYAFWERVIVPLGEALEREQLGCILDNAPGEDTATEGHYELALEVTDQERAKEVVQAVLKSVDD
jgi:hypothetical protein